MNRISQPAVVVVTGATAGVGRATALAFAQRGAHVALLARDEPALATTAEEIRAYGVTALPISVDVSDADEVEAAAGRIEQELGPIDIWVNNAMATVFSPVTEITPAEFARVTSVTYLGFVWGTMAALKRMIARNRGTIVQVGSALAYRSIPLQSAYCGAKHGIRGFTDALRCELLHWRSRVHITMVQMPALNTPQFDWADTRMPHAPRPVAPIFQPEVAARAIVWAAAHRRREVFVGSSTWKAILANKLAPGSLDHYLGRTGYRSQEDDRRAPDAQRSNLWKPVSGLHRMRGRFDAQASEHCPTLWLETHRVATIGLIGATVALAALGLRLAGWQRSRF